MSDSWLDARLATDNQKEPAMTDAREITDAGDRSASRLAFRTGAHSLSRALRTHIGRARRDHRRPGPPAPVLRRRRPGRTDLSRSGVALLVATMARAIRRRLAPPAPLG